MFFNVLRVKPMSKNNLDFVNDKKAGSISVLWIYIDLGGNMAVTYSTRKIYILLIENRHSRTWIRQKDKSQSL